MSVSVAVVVTSMLDIGCTMHIFDSVNMAVVVQTSRALMWAVCFELWRFSVFVHLLYCAHF